MRSTSFAWGALASLLVAWIVPAVLAMQARSATTVVVSPAGRDEAQDGSVTKPYRTIGYALSQAAPGTTILVRQGTYQEDLRTHRNGKRGKPIVLKASGAVTIRGKDQSGRTFELLHDHYVIDGFEFTGGDVLLWLQEADHNTIVNNFFHHAGGECVRAKYRSSRNLFSRNRIEDCGLEDFVRGGNGKNGEGIYLGTAPEQLDRNPTSEADRTNDNTISNNVFVTRGNECVDIKEGSERNIVEFNDCTGQRDPESGGFDVRGNHNVVRYNRSYSNAGAGIRFGGDTAANGINNAAYGNELRNNGGYALKVMQLPQEHICGNTHHDNASGFTNERLIRHRACDFQLPSPGVQPS